MATSSRSPTPPPGKVTQDLKEMKLEAADSDEDVSDTTKVEDMKPDRQTKSAPGSPMKMDTTTTSSTNSPRNGVDMMFSPSPSINGNHEETLGGDITVKLEPGKPPKLARSSTQKVTARPPPLFHHLPDATDEATSTFAVIADCIYSSKYLGDTEHAMECDCAEEWGKQHLTTCHNPVRARATIENTVLTC